MAEPGFGWFDLAWPWIGLGFAVALAVLLFATDLLRSERSVSRWRDLRWLSFLAVVVYLVHQVEEYGIAANGVAHAFPDALCSTLGQPPYPDCAIPPLFYLAVNISLVWVAAPIAALMAKRYPLAGLTLWGVIAVNAVLHIAPAVALQQYDPGLLTAVLLFVPLTGITTRSLMTSGRYRGAAPAVLLAAGLFMHAVLGAGAALFLRGVIPEWAVVVAQPVGIAVGYLAVARADRHLRRAAPSTTAGRAP